MMKQYFLLIIITMITFSLINNVSADLMIFPANGQSNATLEQDKITCYGWAKGKTGFDPMKIPTTSTPPPAQQQQSGGVIRGALGGAVLGAIIGDKSKYAARGAAVGGLVGGVRQNSANTASAQQPRDWEQREANNYANNRNQYNRAYSACLEGKGYTVK
jgi:hypothetical protein